MVVGLSVSFAACQKQEPAKVTPAEVKEKAAETAGAAADYAKQEKDEYVSKVQKEMDEIKADIAKLKTKAKTATAKAKAELDREIKMSEDKWKVAEQKVSELKSASADTWKNMKSGVDNAIEDLKQSWTKAKK